MRDEFLEPRRGEWVAYLRACHRRDMERRQQNGRHCDDGMCHGIIPFGAVAMWQSHETQRLAHATAQPLPARCLGHDATGLILAVLCSFCRAEHQHRLLPEEWDPAQPLTAGCDRGTYRLTLP